MSQLMLLCVDDQREVLASLLRDIEIFESWIDIIEAESAAEAQEIMDEADASGQYVALIISDHVMPHKNGIDFLHEIIIDGRFPHIKKLLLTGQATHEDTIRAINQSHIDAYIAKPWEITELHAIIRRLVTNFIIDQGLDYQPFMAELDQDIIREHLRVH